MPKLLHPVVFAPLLLALSACGSPPPASPPLLAPPPVVPASEPVAIAPPTVSAAAPLPTSAPGSSPVVSPPPELASWISLRDISMREAMVRFSIATANIRTEGSYQGLDHLTELHNPAAHPARFFFRDGKIAMIHVDGGADLEHLRARAILAELGDGGTSLQSRACKACVEHVYPERGLTVSVEGDKVSFVDIYPPTTLATYVTEIYVEPRAFVR
jgi:hypothetical protein